MVKNFKVLKVSLSLDRGVGVNEWVEQVGSWHVDVRRNDRHAFWWYIE